MFRIGKNNGRRHKTSVESKRGQSVEEDYGEDKKSSDDGPAKDPEYWKVNLPSDDLDNLMWGSGGVPPPAPPRPPKYQKDWAEQPQSKNENENENEGESSNTDGEGNDESRGEANKSEGGEIDKNDNILSALDRPAKDDGVVEEEEEEEETPPPETDKIILEDIAWKQRSGFGKYSMGILKHEWEQRRVVLFESGIFKYYSLKKDMDNVKYDPAHATDPNKSPWVYDPKQEARGEIDLMDRREETSEDGGQGGDGTLSPSSSMGKSLRRISSLSRDRSSSNVGGVKVQARERHHGTPGPTPFEIDITRKDNRETWRFCFQSRAIQIEWLSTLKKIAGQASDDDSLDEESEGLANHGFQPGDHIIRWEMLPVLYPIQIHGIVLEAGKNMVIIADFGLASYNNHRADGDLNTFDEKDDSHDIIMAAWEKIKPKEKKRLNVVVVTDPREIRKWSKINYGDRAGKDKKKKKKKGFLKSLISWDQKNGKKMDEETKVDEDAVKTGDGTEEHELEEGTFVNGDAEDAISAEDENGSIIQHRDSMESVGSYGDSVGAEEVKIVEGEPEWAQPGYRPRKRTGSSSSATLLFSDGQSVFSIDHPEDNQSKSELPQSDSAKLVLARTHFILENEDLLPPYHVFYSNSECIAVWCKTGRWSTLQAAVYLVSSSVGFGKSATMLTISVAAAHVILVPALAVGGLAVVGAPLLYLKKSQEKWDKATMRLTDEFWARAGPDVFVEAIEYWGRWGKS